MNRKRFIRLAIILAFTFSVCFADEIIPNFENKSVSVLNEELRKLDISNQIKDEGSLDVLNKTIENVAAPVNNTDGANKKYVDDTIDTEKKVKQIVRVSTAQHVTLGSTALPFDTSIPQKTEGNLIEALNISITPLSATNRLLFKGNINLASGGSNLLGIALFQDTGANALYAQNGPGQDAAPISYSIYFDMAAGTTSTTNFYFRAGTNAGGQIDLNGVEGGGNFFGGKCNSTIEIWEYTP